MNKLGDKFSTHFLVNNETRINRMGYGAMQLTGEGIFGDPKDRDKAIKVLQSAVEQGVNFIDTAEAYGPETNEILIADALHPYPEDLVIATKGGFDRPGPGQWTINGDPKRIEHAIEGSLKRLKVDCIDLWQLHRIDSKLPVEETLAPVAKAVKEGKIRYVGLSEVNIEQIEQAEKIIPIVSVQNIFNLGERRWDDVLDYTARRNIAFIPWYPLASGPDKLHKLADEIAKKHNATTSQIALAWLLHRSPNILLIPGTSSLTHLKENIDTLHINLSVEEVFQLNDSE